MQRGQIKLQSVSSSLRRCWNSFSASLAARFIWDLTFLFGKLKHTSQGQQVCRQMLGEAVVICRRIRKFKLKGLHKESKTDIFKTNGEGEIAFSNADEALWFRKSGSLWSDISVPPNCISTRAWLFRGTIPTGVKHWNCVASKKLFQVSFLV